MSVPNYATRNHPRTLHTILPSGSTTLERAMVDAYDAQPVPIVIEQLADYGNVDVHLLSAVAYGLNIDAWSTNWTEQMQREALRNARVIQARKGTPWAIMQVLKAMGQGDAKIIERVKSRCWGDGTKWGTDGAIWGGAHKWNVFAIRLSQQVTEAQARLIINAVNAVKRKSARLVYIDWTENPLRWGDAVRWGSGYTWGSVNA